VEGPAGVVDVHYPAAGGARAALVLATGPDFRTVSQEVVATLAEVAPYRPGRFYLRELPPLRAVLTGVPLSLLVVDGYADLAPGRPGLGAHCHEEFGVPVVGIAKTRFEGATHAVPVVRGTSATKPVWVTAAGLTAADAASLVAAMPGPNRLPDADRRVDALARGTAAPGARWSGAGPGGG
jgi:deoxyribonuclease V